MIQHRHRPYLVGGFNPSAKYESQLGLLFPTCGKIKAMFQTTNQIFVCPKYIWQRWFESAVGSSSPDIARDATKMTRFKQNLGQLPVWADMAPEARKASDQGRSTHVWHRFPSSWMKNLKLAWSAKQKLIIPTLRHGTYLYRYKYIYI